MLIARPTPLPRPSDPGQTAHPSAHRRAKLHNDREVSPSTRGQMSHSGLNAKLESLT